MNVNFNTSHVTVYPEETSRIDITTEFQYISCYCLSGRHAYSDEIRKNFNTSHVTVYHSGRTAFGLSKKFQYISCYCLSRREVLEYMELIAFQYISCYCLSKRIAREVYRKR